ncbi:kinase-like protein [Rhizoclosmatium globosum]|uniref:Kinase-like protein n=1 Tax=Rhizoclosmatium globosum TaxID=329046 RepID=A0A1Y2CJ91_9FUNG|nr:kinase-like protein [Rhizoclosmatium globosum]|eukprot:ORY46924.1 kinase-like protein [Rhizoclosmatium globosum]
MFSTTNTASVSSSSSSSSKHSSTSSANSVTKTTTAAATTTSADKNQKPLYSGLNSEAMARMAVYSAFTQSPNQLISKYKVQKIIGFGSNGVVLAAFFNATPVAIKIIYKSKTSTNAPVPAEIDILKQFGSNSASTHLLQYIEDWQDQSAFYVVTELHGADWLKNTGSSTLRPVTFGLTHNNVFLRLSLPISTGSSDLWAWSYAHRAHMYATTGSPILPLEPVKKIVKQIENILVGQNTSVRLADFGHAKHASLGIKHYGTLEVSAPEFLPDSHFVSGELDGRAADVFALGIVLFSLVNATGEVPSVVRQVLAGQVGYAALVSCDFGEYPLDEVPDLDEDGWDLLFAMTRVDPTTRVSITQVLAHPFFADVVV